MCAGTANMTFAQAHTLSAKACFNRLYYIHVFFFCGLLETAPEQIRSGKKGSNTFDLCALFD